MKTKSSPMEDRLAGLLCVATVLGALGLGYLHIEKNNTQVTSESGPQATPAILERIKTTPTTAELTPTPGPGWQETLSSAVRNAASNAESELRR